MPVCETHGISHMGIDLISCKYTKCKNGVCMLRFPLPTSSVSYTFPPPKCLAALPLELRPIKKRRLEIKLFQNRRHPYCIVKFIEMCIL